MNLGIAILKDTNKFNFSKPLIINNHEKTFEANLIRDVDYSVLMNINEKFVMHLVKYPKSNYYIKANNDNYLDNSIKIIRTFELCFHNFKELPSLDGFKRGEYKIMLDKALNLNIVFNVIQRENGDYILTTPFISGNKEFLK